MYVSAQPSTWDSGGDITAQHIYNVNFSLFPITPGIFKTDTDRKFKQ